MQTAYGTFWDNGTLPIFIGFLEYFNNKTGLRVGVEIRTEQEYVHQPMPMWPSAGDPGIHDFWMVGAEVFGEAITHSAFADVSFLLDRENHYGFTDIPSAWRCGVSHLYLAGHKLRCPWLFLP